MCLCDLGKCKGEDGLARLRDFDLPMRFSAVFQLFMGSLWVCLFRISRFRLMSLVYYLAS